MLKNIYLSLLFIIPILGHATCDPLCSTLQDEFCKVEPDLVDVAKKVNNSCPDWVKKLKGVPKCPSGGVTKLPEYYPTIAYFMDGASDGYGVKLKEDITKFSQQDREPRVFDSYMGSYFANFSVAGGTYLRDGMISTFSAKEKGFHFRTNKMKDDVLSDDVSFFLESCGYKTFASHDKAVADAPEMGGNLMSPVPGLCAINNKQDLKNFTTFGCTDKNTISLDPEESYWGGVNHIDEKISTVPNPRSTKKPPCNFSLVVQSPQRTLEALSKHVEENQNGEALFFDIDKISANGTRKEGPDKKHYFRSWDEAPGVRVICNAYKELPMQVHFGQRGNLISEKFKVRMGSSKYDFVEVYLGTEEINKIKNNYQYFYINKENKQITSKNESLLSQSELEKVVSGIKTKPCAELTNAEVLKVYQSSDSRIRSLQNTVDKFVQNLKKKMVETNNVCGNGDDLDIIYTPYMISNEMANPTNLLITSDRSIAYPSSLSNFFEKDLQDQFQARGLHARELPEIYTRLLKTPNGQNSSGGLHCLTNSLQICAP